MSRVTAEVRAFATPAPEAVALYTEPTIRELFARPDAPATYARVRRNTTDDLTAQLTALAVLRARDADEKRAAGVAA